MGEKPSTLSRGCEVLSFAIHRLPSQEGRGFVLRDGRSPEF
jgi:hypothetical protein